MKKIISLVLALAMITLALAACGGGSSTKVKINFTLSVYADGVKVIDGIEHQLSVSETKIPTILEAACDALAVNAIQYEAEDELISISVAGTKYEMGKDDANVYAWIYRVNGVEPTSGKMNTNLIEDGQSIELELITIPLETNTDAE